MLSAASVYIALRYGGLKISSKLYTTSIKLYCNCHCTPIPYHLTCISVPQCAAGTSYSPLDTSACVLSRSQYVQHNTSLEKTNNEIHKS